MNGSSLLSEATPLRVPGIGECLYLQNLHTLWRGPEELLRAHFGDSCASPNPLRTYSTSHSDLLVASRTLLFRFPFQLRQERDHIYRQSGEYPRGELPASCHPETFSRTRELGMLGGEMDAFNRLRRLVAGMWRMDERAIVKRLTVTQESNPEPFERLPDWRQQLVFFTITILVYWFL